MADGKNFYITTAISYVNGVPHLGHAYESILTDCIARFKRLDGYNVHFLTGTDEHGEKIANTAEQSKMPPREFCDQNAEIFREMTGQLNISNDDFIRTVEDRHHISSKAIWQKIKENGDIYLDKYEGWYSVRDEAYFGEDELTTDPETGDKLAPSGAPVTWKIEPSYFFKLSNYTDKLLQLYKDQPDFIQPETRRNEIVSFVKQGLRDLSISRTSFDWGIPVPDDDKHVMYVWLDALTNYITGVGFPNEQSEQFKTFWPADFHVIGKDIIRFHTVYWPAFLMAAGVPLPKHVFAHGFINIEGQKMSKSLGNVTAPQALIDTYGLDQMRYLLMREVPHGQDGNFSHEHGVQRINGDLANSLGNLAQRTLSMIHKNCDEKIPAPNNLTKEDQSLLTAAQKGLIETLRPQYSEFKVHRALESIMKLADYANGYIDAQAPWTLKKTDPERMATVLYVLAEVIRCLAITMQPVTPEAANQMLDQLKTPENERNFEHLSEEYALKAGVEIDKPEGIFPRIEINTQSEVA